MRGEECAGRRDSERAPLRVRPEVARKKILFSKTKKKTCGGRVPSPRSTNERKKNSHPHSPARAPPLAHPSLSPPPRAQGQYRIVPEGPERHARLRIEARFEAAFCPFFSVCSPTATNGKKRRRRPNAAVLKGIDETTRCPARSAALPASPHPRSAPGRTMCYRDSLKPA